LGVGFRRGATEEVREKKKKVRMGVVGGAEEEPPHVTTTTPHDLCHYRLQQPGFFKK